MSVEIVVPEDHLGGVIGDLNQRQGQIRDVSNRSAKSVIQAAVSLRNMFGYSTRLRSLSEGRGTFSMHFSSYDASAYSRSVIWVDRLTGIGQCR